jgi:hypothetical protein
MSELTKEYFDGQLKQERLDISERVVSLESDMQKIKEALHIK